MKKTNNLLLSLTIAGFSILNAGEININKIENANKIENVTIKKNFPKLSDEDKNYNSNCEAKNNILNSIKVSYVKRLNQIEDCVLLSESVDDIIECNQKVYHLSKDINKKTNRYMKSQKVKKFNKNN